MVASKLKTPLFYAFSATFGMFFQDPLASCRYDIHERYDQPQTEAQLMSLSRSDLLSSLRCFRNEVCA